MRSEGEDGVGDRNVGAGLAAPVQCSIDAVTGEKRGKRAKREESVQGTVAAMPFTAYTCFTRIHMTTGGGAERACVDMRKNIRLYMATSKAPTEETR